MTWEVDSFSQLLAMVIDFLVSLSGSVLMVVVVFLLSRLIRRRFHRFAERRGMHRSVPALFDNVVQAVVFVVIAFLIMAALGVNTRSLATFAGLVTAALTFSVQDVLKNIFCGFYLLAERPFAAGDRIRVGAEDGYIERIDLRVTRIRNDRQELVFVPNTVFFSQISIARSTLQFRALTVQRKGVQQTRETAEDLVRATITEVVPAGSVPAFRLLQVGPAGCDFEITVSQLKTEVQQQEIIDCLHQTFSDATISVIAR